MNPIQSLQHMLNNLARFSPTLPRLAETGVFDEATLEAVMIFQRDNDLPVTGIVDQQTWDIITAAYYLNQLKNGAPPLLHAFPGSNTPIPEGDSNAVLFVVQAMLTALASVVSNFEATEPTGSNSGSTTRNLKRLQALAQLEQTGALDRATWAVLSHIYRALVTRHPALTFPL